jgi:hypothetical protein
MDVREINVKESIVLKIGMEHEVEKSLLAKAAFDPVADVEEQVILQFSIFNYLNSSGAIDYKYPVIVAWRDSNINRLKQATGNFFKSDRDVGQSGFFWLNCFLRFRLVFFDSRRICGYATRRDHQH